MYFRDQQMAWDGEKIKSETAAAGEEESTRRWSFVSFRFGSQSYEIRSSSSVLLILIQMQKISQLFKYYYTIFDLRVCIISRIFVCVSIKDPQLWDLDTMVCLLLVHTVQKIVALRAKWESSLDFDFSIYFLSLKNMEKDLNLYN